MNKTLTQSLEKYLIAIDELTKNGKSIIVKDVAVLMNKGGAATADAVKKLKERKLINYEPYGNISLTPKGRECVSIKKYRHNTIAKFLNNVLDIDVKAAEKNASAIEYSMTKDVLIRLVNFMDFMEQCSCQEPKWVKSCKDSLGSGEMSEKCKKCKSGNSCDCCCGKLN